MHQTSYQCLQHATSLVHIEWNFQISHLGTYCIYESDALLIHSFFFPTESSKPTKVHHYSDLCLYRTYITADTKDADFNDTTTLTR
jgi:hypothetical protein